ncbi:MAG: hypothetical protein HDR04_09145 [Lachnospiraceae bacterium]|nr:hypothetical protein [Lachnospiraceae bacterium]
MNKHEAMKEFFKPKVMELCGSVLGFNFSNEEAESVAFVTEYADKLIKKYKVGAEKAYGFSVIITKPYSIGSDDVNLEAMNFAQAFMDWLEEQNRKRQYPDFPDGCQIKKMENLQNMPNLAAVNVKEGLARYMIQCRLIYFEK